MSWNSLKSPLAAANLVQKLMIASGKENVTTDSILKECSFGQHDAAWLAFYGFYAIECNLDSAKPLLPLWKLCQYCGWWWPFGKCVIVSDRPTKLQLDDQGKLHSDRGPAITFADGFEVYVKHGKIVS